MQLLLLTAVTAAGSITAAAAAAAAAGRLWSLLNGSSDGSFKFLRSAQLRFLLLLLQACRKSLLSSIGRLVHGLAVTAMSALYACM
jgi:hypothetical protein